MPPKSYPKRTLVGLSRLRLDHQVYLGSDNGKITFDDTLGWFHGCNHNVVELLPSTRIALGLTECCAHFGRGKVLFWPKDHPSINTPIPTHTAKFWELPDLVYIRFNWSDEEKSTWFTTTHERRALQLNARNALDLDIVCMPITLSYERGPFTDPIYIPGLAGAAMFYGSTEQMYLGFDTDLKDQMTYVLKSTNQARNFYKARSERLTNFKMDTATEVVQRLDDMVRENHQPTLWIFRDLVIKSIEAQKEWALLGGTKVENDKHLSASTIAEFKRLKGNNKKRLEKIRDERGYHGFEESDAEELVRPDVLPETAGKPRPKKSAAEQTRPAGSDNDESDDEDGGGSDDEYDAGN